MRSIAVSLTILTAASLAGQQPAAAPATPWAAPAGWTIKTDGAAAPADTKFQTMGPGFHVTSGPAALYYRVADQAKGDFTLKATFGQRTKPATGHSEAYGVFFGGTDVGDNAKQQYYYLVVRDDGSYYFAHRAGAEVHPVVPWAASDAVKKAAENGSATNEVSVKVTADSVHMMVNGTQVKALSRKGFVTDGQFGLRVNHGLNVHIANFGLQQ
jgi:hypothetical protein